MSDPDSDNVSHLPAMPAAGKPVAMIECFKRGG